MRVIKILSLSILSIWMLVGCLDANIEIEPENQNDLENVIIPDDFSFRTTTEVSFELKAPSFLQGAVFSLVNYKKGIDSVAFAKGSFDENGIYEATYSIPIYIDTILVISHYVGLISEVVIPVNSNHLTFDYSEFYEGTSVDKSNIIVPEKSATVDGFSYLGGYDSQGVPEYLVGRDNVEQNLLDDLNSSLPEGTPLTQSHPEYLGGAETNIRLKENADVWVTFVAEGAGWRNALGYYTFQLGNEPKTADDITDLKIIFPNSSMSGSGGGLLIGDKVHLGRFDAGTVVAWFLVANGWNGNTVGNGNAIHYSQSSLNAENTESLKDHMVLLYDEGRSQLLMGFEDVPRDWSWVDNDFNDAVFYATVNPFSAVDAQSVQAVDAANDSDGDGINDEIDDFPFDPNKSFNNFSPSQGAVGSIAYEDLWPSKGDYDFNDLVIDYNYNMIANSSNKITSIEATFTVNHIGGSFKNGFAFILPVESNTISSVENQVLNVGYVSVESNGVEPDGNNSVIFAFENAQPLVGKTINLVISFNSPINTSDLGGAPFNPFIVVNGDRSREVHLPDMVPTNKGLLYLGQDDDDSDIGYGRYYKSNRNLPWAIAIPSSYVIPQEKVRIDIVYPKFINWANSGGTLNQEWYLNSI